MPAPVNPVESVRALDRRNPGATFRAALPRTPTSHLETFASAIGRSALVLATPTNALAAADRHHLQRTATVEAALLDVPISSCTQSQNYRLALQASIRTSSSACQFIADREVAPELIQEIRAGKDCRGINAFEPARSAQARRSSPKCGAAGPGQSKRGEAILTFMREVPRVLATIPEALLSYIGTRC